jgi:hypothetical protein
MNSYCFEYLKSKIVVYNTLINSNKLFLSGSLSEIFIRKFIRKFLAETECCKIDPSSWRGIGETGSFPWPHWPDMTQLVSDFHFRSRDFRFRSRDFRFRSRDFRFRSREPSSRGRRPGANVMIALLAIFKLLGCKSCQLFFKINFIII